MNLINTANGNHLDLDDTQGQYEYVGEFLSEHAANGDVWKCLSALRARVAELEATQDECTIDVGVERTGTHRWLRPEDVRGYVDELRAEIQELKNKLKGIDK